MLTARAPYDPAAALDYYDRARVLSPHDPDLSIGYEAVARAYGQLLLEVYDASRKPVAGSAALSAEQQELLELVTGKTSPVWFPRRDTPDHMSRVEKDRYNGLVANLDKIAANATNSPPARAMVVADLPEPWEPHVFKRGNPSRPGESVSRAFLQVLSHGEAHSVSIPAMPPLSRCLRSTRASSFTTR